MIDDTIDALLIKRMLASFERHPRHRCYALTDDQAKRQLANIYRECESKPYPNTVFHGFLERLQLAGWPVVRPAPEPKAELPKPVTDPVSGEPLKNPWLAPMPQDEAEQRALMAERNALAANEPELARHWQRMATDPHRYLLELKLEDEARVRRNSANKDYSAKIHEINVFCASNETDKGAFVVVNRNDHERVEVFQREAIPLPPLFESDDAARDTMPHKKIMIALWKSTTDETQISLKDAIKKVFEREKTIRTAAHQKAEAEREESVRRAVKDAENLREASAGIVRLASGQIVTMGTSRNKPDNRPLVEERETRLRP